MSVIKLEWNLWLIEITETADFVQMVYLFITTHSVFFTVKQSATQIAHCNLEEYITPALHSRSMNLQAEKLEDNFC